MMTEDPRFVSFFFFPFVDDTSFPSCVIVVAFFASFFWLSVFLYFHFPLSKKVWGVAGCGRRNFWISSMCVLDIFAIIITSVRCTHIRPISNDLECITSAEA